VNKIKKTNDVLIAKANLLHDKTQDSANQAVVYAAKCGAKLIEIKANCERGKFTNLLGSACNVSERQAKGYMKIARERPELLDN